MFYRFSKKSFILIHAILIICFIFFPTNKSSAKISDRYEVKSFWEIQPIMPGAAKYFIRTEKIEKKTKSLNNHPIKISPVILRKMLKQLSYKYDRKYPEIPLFSEKELVLLSEYVPSAFRSAKPNEDVTFVIKGPHSSQRWSFKEDRLTAGRMFIANNQLNLILGAVQVNLQPTLDEQYQGNVWETARLKYDTGRRQKEAEYDGMIVVFDDKRRGIYRKSNNRKDWFVFTNTAYKQAKEDIDSKKTSKEQYKTLQEQIDTLQKQLNQKPNQRRSAPPPRTRTRQQTEERNRAVVSPPKKTIKQNNPNVVEQRLNTINNLYKKGILSEEEYNKKRDEILKGL